MFFHVYSTGGATLRTKRRILGKARMILWILFIFAMNTANIAAVLAQSKPEVQVKEGTTRVPNDTEIYGGGDAPQTYPWMVSFRMDDGTHYCGGTLVAQYWILTAAHCFQEKGGQLDPSRTWARIGFYDLIFSDEGEVIKIKEPVIYNPNVDMAMVQLERPSTHTPISLADDNASYAQGTYLGWGYTSPDGATSTILQQVNLPFVSESLCGYGSGYFCTGVYSGAKSLCVGDSGGPLIAFGKQVGIVSRRPQLNGVCALNYNASTKVGIRLPWINEVLQRCAVISASSTNTDPCMPDNSPPSLSNFQVALSGAIAQLRVTNPTDNATGIAEVRYSAKWNNVWRSVGNSTQSPYSLDWNMCSSGVPDGAVEFGVEVIDGAGNKYIWSQHHNNPTLTKSFNCNPGGGSNPTGSAKLYALSNFGGATVWSGNTGFSNAPNGDSYSFELPSGWSARSWRGDNRTGEERCWNGSVSNLQDHGWHLAIQSTEIFDHNVCGTNTSGDAVTMCADNGCWNFVVGYYSLPYWGMNDILTKITNVPSNLSVMLYREGGLRGTVECFNSPRDPLPSGGAYDLWKQVTDVVVFNGKNCPMAQQGAVIFYNETNFGDYYWAAGNKPGIVNMADLGPRDLTNDSAQSMRIPPGKSAIISEHDGGQGSSSTCQTGDVPNLGSLGNQVSSVRIFDNTNCAPDAPTSLSVTGTTYHNVTLAWTHPEAVNLKFKVYKWDGYNFVEHAVSDQGVTSFTREDAQCNMTEYYKVAALTSDGRESKPIGWVAATTSSCPLPAEPQFVYLDKFTYEGETIFWWYNSPFATEYNITAYGDVGEQYSSGWQTGTLWYAKELRPDRVYLVELVARNEVGETANSLNFVWVKLAPPNITSNTAKCNAVTLSWQNNSAYAQGFKVYRDEQVVAELGAEATSYVDTGVAASSSYVYKVEIVGENAFAASSSQLEYVTTPSCSEPQQLPAAPTNLRHTITGTTSLTLEWNDNSDNEDGFHIYRWTGPEQDTWPLIATVGANATSFVHEVGCGYGGFYKMTAYNAAGESSETGWIVAHTQDCGTIPTPQNRLYLPLITR